MDYEMKYKAVLKTAKQWIKDGCTDKEKVCLECVFPELRESEDERARKELINFILYKAGALIDEDTEHRYIAYLEKQKELPFVKDVMLGYPGLYFYDGERMHFQGNPAMEEKQKEQKPRWEINNPHTTKWTKEMIDEKFKELVEEYHKQKPTEKQDYSGLNDLERAIHRGFLSAGLEDVPVTVIKETAQECLAQMKPAEWSEEDEEILDSLIHLYSIEYSEYVCPWANGTITYGDVVNFLKSLRPPSIQDKFDEAMHVADKFEEGYKAGVYDTKTKSWKPSEEQMESLRRAVDKLAKIDVVASVSLSIMYDNLKKLKEGQQ